MTRKITYPMGCNSYDSSDASKSSDTSGSITGLLTIKEAGRPPTASTIWSKMSPRHFPVFMIGVQSRPSVCFVLRAVCLIGPSTIILYSGGACTFYVL